TAGTKDCKRDIYKTNGRTFCAGWGIYPQEVKWKNSIVFHSRQGLQAYRYNYGTFFVVCRVKHRDYEICSYYRGPLQHHRLQQ
ncbi:hypothetical protein DM870_26305, partial [Escherichia coli]